MGKADYESVLASMRLADGRLFPIPLTLPVDKFDEPRSRQKGRPAIPATIFSPILTVEEIFEWSQDDFADNVLGITRCPASARG